MIIIALRFQRTFSALGRVAQSVEQRTENPRVGGSIPSPPTTLVPLKLGIYRHFVGIFFYFSSAEFNCNMSKRSPVSSWFTVILSARYVHNVYTPFLDSTDFKLMHEHGYEGLVMLVEWLFTKFILLDSCKKDRSIYGRIWPCMGSCLFFIWLVFSDQNIRTQSAHRIFTKALTCPS